MLSQQDILVARHNFTQASLLVVEDNNDVWIIVNLMLKRHLPEVKIHRVVNAHQALSYLDEAIAHQGVLPKLILQNLYLPLLKNGLELLQQSRTKLAACSCQQIPILVMSSSTDPEDIRRAYSAGASSFYLKPITIAGWTRYFEQIRHYWWESIMLPMA